MSFCAVCSQHNPEQELQRSRSAPQGDSSAAHQATPYPSTSAAHPESWREGKGATTMPDAGTRCAKAATDRKQLVLPPGSAKQEASDSTGAQETHKGWCGDKVTCWKVNRQVSEWIMMVRSPSCRFQEGSWRSIQEI
ncbi:hypothetical protein AMECASPLE_018065 [Ameca splendens]|uniref:Uncharacterized protein n=1 Tax=Ameca splendens TaxID=208324 RepID=A0ABV0YE63_9TELE